MMHMRELEDSFRTFAIGILTFFLQFFTTLKASGAKTLKILNFHY